MSQTREGYIMKSGRLQSAGLAIVVACAAMAAASSAEAAEKGPPACAKIFFRPLPSGQNDGEQEAGLYSSRFSHIELKGEVKSGEAQNYYVTSHNKKLAPVSGAIPAAAANCAKEKKLPAPSNAAASCTGQRFATVIAHAGKDKIVLLYGLHDREWRYCGAGSLGSES
jgi:hypothetical protein